MSYEWTPQSGYGTPFGLWDGAERLLDALRAMGRRGAPIGYGREAMGDF